MSHERRTADVVETKAGRFILFTADQPGVERKRMSNLPEVLELAAALRVAARDVAGWDWGTSVSEAYHFRRMEKMDALRAAVARIDAAEKELLTKGEKS